MSRSNKSSPAVSREAFRAREAELWPALLERQRALREAGVATLIIIAGPEGGGKGDLADRLNQWFDARGVETHGFWADSDEERERPWMWRFWRRLPPRGNIAIMFGAWYWMPLYRRVRAGIGDAELEREARRIAAHERMLAADGLLIVKLWLHLDHEAHEQRMRRRREAQRYLRGRAAEGSGKRQYGLFTEAASRLRAMTGGEPCPWHHIDARDDHARDLAAGGILLDVLTRRPDISAAMPALDRDRDAEAPRPSALARVDPDARLSADDYKRKLKHWQSRLTTLAWRAWAAGIPCVIVFEGWDAAGKGGIIRRLVAPIDARLYQVVPVGAPNEVERSRHYLWRFWRRLPRAGFLTIYDRSWYGRVLVERVEGFVGEPEWRQAYDEINDFEAGLVEHGIVLAKYWLQVSADEQLRRFRDRERIAWKQHKLTDDDWRNRERREDYNAAAEQMLAQTGAAAAPWTVISAEDKRHARIAVMRNWCKRLEDVLDGRA